MDGNRLVSLGTVTTAKQLDECDRVGRAILVEVGICSVLAMVSSHAFKGR